MMKINGFMMIMFLILFHQLTLVIWLGRLAQRLGIQVQSLRHAKAPLVFGLTTQIEIYFGDE